MPIKKSYKDVVLGESGIGSKTSLINVIAWDGFDPDTERADVVYFITKSFYQKVMKSLLSIFGIVLVKNYFYNLLLNCL